MDCFLILDWGRVLEFYLGSKRIILRSFITIRKEAFIRFLFQGRVGFLKIFFE